MTYQNERAPVGRGAGELHLPSDGGTDHTTPVPPAPDAAEIARALGVLFEPDDIVELRAIFTHRRKNIACGYYDGGHRDDLIRDAARLNKDGAAVYVTLNAIDPQLLGRYANRIEQGAPTTTSDANVIRRRWLLLDFDPVRPKDTSATDAQLEASKALARECFKVLRDEGWPDPVVAESGNGVHLLYPIDLPNDPETTVIVKGALQGLAQRFDTDGMKLDQSVFNAGRIVKLYGTVANKGDHTLETPWRLSRVERTPKRETIVTLDQLRGLAAPLPAHAAARDRPHYAGTFDLDAFLGRLDIGYNQDTHTGGERYKLDHCPFNSEHGPGEAAVFRGADGKLGFKCQHNSCADRHWADLRERVDGPQASRREGVRGSHRDSTGNATADVSGGEEWPEPMPLPAGLPPVAAFDFALLPDTLRPWAEDIAERVQCAPDFVGVPVMTGLGAVLGRKLGIRPQAQTDWTEFPNQWALLIGRPGVLKSPAMEQALGPLKRLAAEATKAHEAAMAGYRVEALIAKLKAEAGEKAARKALEKNNSGDVTQLLFSGEAPEPPTLKRYIANDTTAAALGELHRQHPHGLSVFRDKLVSLLKVLDREENSEARGFYLTGWNGNSSYTFDRIVRGLNLNIPAVCLSLLGSTQPGRIAEYLGAAVRGGAGDDGLIQRFGLLVWPDAGSKWRDVDRWPDNEAKREAFEVFEHFDKLDLMAAGATKDKFDDALFLRFDDEALALFRGWRADLEARLRGDELHPTLESHLAKYRKLVPALALTLHLASRATGNVGKRPTLQALAWAEYLETHAARAYASVTISDTVAAKAILERLRKGDLPRTFSSRDVWRPGWMRLSDRQRVTDALRLLVDLDWLVTHRRPTGGRTATVYEANPRGFAR